MKVLIDGIEIGLRDLAGQMAEATDEERVRQLTQLIGIDLDEGPGKKVIVGVKLYKHYGGPLLAEVGDCSFGDTFSAVNVTNKARMRLWTDNCID